MAFFDLDEDRQGALRGRLKHFNQLGLPGLKAGRGARISYSLEQASQWLIGLTMLDLGVDPTIIVRSIKGHWKIIGLWARRALDDESQNGNPVFLTLRPRLMSAKDQLDTVSWIGGFRRYQPKLKQPENVVMFLDRCSEEGWLCIRNLTDDMSRLENLLDSYLDAKEEADIARFDVGEDA